MSVNPTDHVYYSSTIFPQVIAGKQWRRKVRKTRGANLCNYVHLQIGERNIWVTYILYDCESMSI